jgi:putative oxidoreductase
MRIATVIARILLGVVFLLAGVTAFAFTPPPQAGLAGAFAEVFYRSHWALFLGIAQIVMSLCFLTNRLVPVGLLILAGFLYNSFAYHITMAQAGIAAPVVALGLGIVVAWPYRERLCLLLAA